MKQLSWSAVAASLCAGLAGAQSVPNATNGHLPPTGALARADALATSDALGLTSAGSGPNILLYDQSSIHRFAREAALGLGPSLGASVTLSDSDTFDTLLASGSWDLVLVDCPGPAPGWGNLMGYVNAGGRAVVSFWDWDNSTPAGDPNLAQTFDVAVAADLDLDVSNVFDSNESGLFVGISDSFTSFDDTWFDDGDEFHPLNDAVGLANAGNPATPVMVRGNSGHTIAAFVIDELGPVYEENGSATGLWENMILALLGPQTPRILVYDNSSENELAPRAANAISPGGTVVGDAGNFSVHLAQGEWDLVAINAPGNAPSWPQVIDYVEDGGRVVCSYWNWDSQTDLATAFDVAVDGSISLVFPPQTLYDSGTSAVFDGVTMPNSDWSDEFDDDGDEFLPLDKALGLAHIGDPTTPVLVQGNAGRTIASFLIDEAGGTWLADGSGVALWGNLMRRLYEPEAACSIRTGVLDLNPYDFTCESAPVIGEVWEARVSTEPTIGTQTLTTFVTTGFGGPTDGVALFGHELLILPPYLETTGYGEHPIPISASPAFLGITLHTQGARLELSGGGIEVVLLNAQDLQVGF
ncbi:MAG: hypothetical protein AAF682_11580 [Planctomycetota bacterium]